ncbi:unnamed protein product [Effrenium voratum]|nr:unnamed protein product [Effrenium voratum]
MPDTAEPEQPAVSESCEAGPKSKEQVEEAGKEVEKAGKAEKVAAEQVSEEKLSEQLAETLPEKLDEVKPGFGDRVGEADEALDIGEGERKVEEEKAQEDMAGKASEREPELVEASAQDGGDIVDTWLINDKPAVREQFAVPVCACRARKSVHRPVRDDNFDRDVAQVAFHLSPLPNTTVVGYLEGLPAEECDAVLSHFDPERRRELLELLTEELRGTSSSSSSAKMLPPRVSQFGGRALGLAGTLAALAKQGISEMAPEASQAASKGAGTAALEMKRAAAAASHAAGWASSQARQSVDRAAHTKSAEYAKTAASSALSAAKVGVSSAAHQAEAVAGAARHSVTHMVNTSPAAGSSARLARQVTTDAKQKVTGAAEVAKEGLASVSKGMASFFKNR